jgi:putative transcriptional regulator
MSGSHPETETLTAYASGALKAGARLVVGEHLRACAACRCEVEQLEAVGGGLLTQEAPAALAPDALDRALAALEMRGPTRARLTLTDMMKGFWIPLGPHLAIKPLRQVADPGETVFFIRAGGGQALPEHGHSGPERLVVLKGAFEDQHGRYGAGELVERGPEDRHRPVACHGETCLCLSATDGRLRLSGLARLMQPFLGI